MPVPTATALRINHFLQSNDSRRLPRSKWGAGSLIAAAGATRGGGGGSCLSGPIDAGGSLLNDPFLSASEAIGNGVGSTTKSRNSGWLRNGSNGPALLRLTRIVL